MADATEPNVEKSEKLLKREEEKRRKKAEKEAKDAAKKEKAAAPSAGPVTIKLVANPPIDLDPCTGTRDFYPEDMRLREWLFGHFNAVAELCGFQNYDAPVLEMQELYKRKAGEEITQQMYAFNDKSEPPREVTLRPEMTPSLARMVLKQGPTLNLPLKWSSIPQCWRYETTTRGRKREHYQWNMDIVGCRSIAAEVELLYAITLFFKRIGITSAEVGIKVNSRKVLGSVLDSFGVPKQKFAPVCVVVDKLDKIGPDEVKKQLVEDLQVPEDSAEKIIQSLSLKSVEELAKLCGGVENDAVKELTQLFAMAKDYGFDDYLLFDASVVRGLAYYTGVVFECFDRRGELRAICGGGRYDALMSLYGAEQEVPACGFGFGDCVIIELLKDLNKLPNTAKQVDFCVAAYNADMQSTAMRVAAAIREGGCSADVLLEPKKKIASAFEYADKVGADNIVFVAPDEWAKGVVAVKDLRASADAAAKQVEVRVVDLGIIKEVLARSQADVSSDMARLNVADVTPLQSDVQPEGTASGAEAGACSTCPTDGHVLHVNVASVNIKKIDLKAYGIETAICQVCLECEGQKAQTKELRGLDPTFEEHFYFKISDPATVKVTAYFLCGGKKIGDTQTYPLDKLLQGKSTFKAVIVPGGKADMLFKATNFGDAEAPKDDDGFMDFL